MFNVCQICIWNFRGRSFLYLSSVILFNHLETTFLPAHTHSLLSMHCNPVVFSFHLFVIFLLFTAADWRILFFLAKLFVFI